VTLGLVATLAIAFHATPSPAHFEGVAELKIVAASSMRDLRAERFEPVVTSLRLLFTEAAWRLEKEIAPPGRLSSFVGDLLGGHDTFRLVALGKVADPTKSWIVNDRTKTYALLVIEPSKSLEGDDRCWTIRRTGNDAVTGLACEKVAAQRKDGSESWEACLSRDLPSMAMESLTHLPLGPTESGNHTDAERWIETARRSGVNGRPLRAISRERDGTEKLRIEVVNVERRALPASLFEVPDGYRETTPLRATAQSAERERELERDEKDLVESMKRWPPEPRKQLEPLLQMHGGEKP
jgi:hypothetical protein